MKVAVVTGGSSGIGLSTASALVKSGCKVYELSRRDTIHENGIIHLKTDVSCEEEVFTQIEKIRMQEPSIDILVCCAGFGISGAAEFTQTNDAKKLMDVNLFGTVHSIRAVIPTMREQGSGRIVCVSSVAAPISIPFQSWYSVSKAAISSYCAALREEVRPFGIDVSVVLPGDTHTGFTSAREKNIAGDDIYRGRIQRSVSKMERDELGGVSPEEVAKVICKAALSKRVRPSYIVGFPYQCAVKLARILPERLFCRLIGTIYAQ